MLRFQGLYVLVALFFAILLSLNAGADDSAAIIRQLQIQTSKNHTPLSYGAARQLLFGRLHLQENKGTYFVHDVYCQKDYTKSDFASKSGVGPNRIPDPTVINAEHTWPQSRFSHRFPKDVQKTDLHHLFPTHSQLNAIRGNYKFGEVSSSEHALPCGTTALGRAENGGYRFEPPDAHKGNVARALFYFSVRYSIHIDADEEQTLREWNKADPVDNDESARNAAIAKLQGNRNPFIDNQKLADQIADF